MIQKPEFRDYKLYWGLENPDTIEIPGNCIKIKADSWTYFLTALNCKYWITCVNIERSLKFKKKTTRYLNTWHGTPFVNVGNLTAGRNDFNFSHVDLFCVDGDYSKDLYQKAFNVKPESMILTGSPKDDELYNSNSDEVLRIRKQLGIPNGKKVILYAPTWRDSNDGGKSYLLKPPIDINNWKSELSDDYIILLRTHPYTNKLHGIKFDDFVRDYTTYPKVNNLLIAADYLVSDYSSIMFDYSILNKPMFSYAYDYDTYKIERGGFALDPKDALADGFITNEDELLNVIKNCNYESECKKTKLFHEKYVKYGGNATEECISALFRV
jgi:CDP-glycerol glycerophosphotransferase